MASNTGNWVWSDEGLVAAPADGPRRYLHRDFTTVAAGQPSHENALLLLVALLPLLLAAVALVAG